MPLTITLDISTDEEEKLRNKARREGLDISGYIKLLADRSTRPRRPRTTKPRNGVELANAIMDDPRITGYGDPAINAPDLARDLRRRASSRDWS